MLEKSSVHAGFIVFKDVLQVLAGERKRLLLRLKSLQKVGGNSNAPMLHLKVNIGGSYNVQTTKRHIIVENGNLWKIFSSYRLKQQKKLQK